VFVNVSKEASGNAGDSSRLRFRAYIVPAVFAGLSGLAEVFGETGRTWLRYEREPIAAGELWRLVTGHLVHLGPSHALMNVAALAVLALVLSRYLKSLDWLSVFLFSALAIDGGLFWAAPSVVWYVGLSGVLHGFWASATVFAWRDDQRQAAVLTALIVFKLSYESWYGPVPMTGAVAAGPVIAVAHAYGAAGGVCWALSALAIRSLKRSL
jgi:rhomboid family GlyGly-CTERM serine protease